MKQFKVRYRTTNGSGKVFADPIMANSKSEALSKFLKDIPEECHNTVEVLATEEE